MIKVGDKVKFLNDVGGGTVTGYINKNTVNVEGEDGFEVPYPINQLVNLSAPEMNAETTKSSAQKPQEVETPQPVFVEKEGEQINGKNSPDFYFCFVPVDSKNPLSKEIEMYLVNDSNYTLLYCFAYLKPDSAETIKQGTVKSNSRIKLDALTQQDLSELPDYGFQLLYYKKTDSKWNNPIAKKFRVNPVKFYKESTFQSNSYFRKNALVLQISADTMQTELNKLTQDDFKKVVKSKETQTTLAKKLHKRSPEEVVIDLHINELIDSTEGLSKRELLEIQTNKVITEMNAAIKDHVKRIVFIHGVGQGVLKQEVAQILTRKFKKFYFQDASFKEYGYGATMVIIKK